MIADNYGGQNKNEEVLRFRLWLVEAEILPLVRIIFLVRGHTKNACDQLFNFLKQEYGNTNIETFDALMSVFNRNEDIEASHIGPDELFDFRVTLNQ